MSQDRFEVCESLLPDGSVRPAVQLLKVQTSFSSVQDLCSSQDVNRNMAQDKTLDMNTTFV